MVLRGEVNISSPFYLLDLLDEFSELVYVTCEYVGRSISPWTIVEKELTKVSCSIEKVMGIGK